MSIKVTDPAVAASVINEAKATGVFGGDVPADDDAKINTANELVALAEQAKDAGVGGGAVDRVLGAAQQNGAAPAPAAPPANPFAGGAPAPAPQGEAAPAAPPAPAPEPVAAGPVDVNTIIPDYDDLKVGDVLTAMEALTDEQIAVVKAYEASEGERAKILGFERHTMAEQPAPTVPATPPAAAPQPAVPAQVDPSQYETTEPWLGYNKAKIGDIVERIETTLRENGEAAKPLLAHVWEYEKANKERTRLITKLTEIAQNGVSVAPPAQPAPEPQSAPVPPPTPAEGNDVVAEAPFQPSAEAPQPAPAPVQTPPSAPTAPPVQSGGIVDPLPNGATQRAAALVSQQFAIPPEWQGEMPVLPSDYTQLSDVDVARFQSQFNALHSRAIYVLAQAEGYVADAKAEAERLIRQYVAQHAEQFNAKSTGAEKDAVATQNTPEVQHARKIQHEWGRVAEQVKALATGYEKDCERLSREQTRRDNERSATR